MGNKGRLFLVLLASLMLASWWNKNSSTSSSNFSSIYSSLSSILFENMEIHHSFSLNNCNEYLVEVEQQDGYYQAYSIYQDSEGKLGVYLSDLYTTTNQTGWLPWI